MHTHAHAFVLFGNHPEFLDSLCRALIMTSGRDRGGKCDPSQSDTTLQRAMQLRALGMHVIIVAIIRWNHPGVSQDRIVGKLQPITLLPAKAVAMK